MTVFLSIGCICLTSLLLSRSTLNAVSPMHRCETSELVRHVRVGGDADAVRLSNANVPLFQVDPLYQAEHNRIDNEKPKIRCARYGLTPYHGPQRRIFYGTMISDENWEVFRMNAIEVYGVYHAAAFVESNTTHTVTPRKLRFKDSEERDLLVESGMFGTNTKIYLEYWLEDRPDLREMDRESEQRNTIVKIWKDAGMQPEDVALMADVDEVFSRDFLRAIQTCDFPELRPGQDCHKPKICPTSLSFESSPYCFKKKEWFHPDIISGQCVDGIGDPTERVVPLRTHRRQYGERDKAYGRYNFDLYPDEVVKSGRYPLFNGPDIRTVHGDRGVPYTLKDRPGDQVTGAYGVAFHFHNWFTDLKMVRNKYLTYAHFDRDIMSKTMSQASEDLDVYVRCVKGLDNNANPNTDMREYYLEGWNIEGPRPIFFLNKTYTEERHRLVKEMLVVDEEKYGSSYDADGKWVENTLHNAPKRKAVTASKEKAPKKKKVKKKVQPASILNPHANSSTATVMGMATGFTKQDMTRFVGSLRKTGYRGHIIIGVNADVDQSILEYFEKRDVTPKFIKYTDCTFEPFYKTEEELQAEGSISTRKGLTICAESYPDVKVRWIKFPMGRDWLRDCKTCTGPVMIADVRDLYFQRDPFGPGSPEVTSLQVFEEHPDLSTEHWLVDWPVGECKGVHLKKPMLCSGTTIGTLDDMMKYLDKMYEEMKRWLADPKCRFKTLADDQSIHNWLFYNGDLENAVAVKHREGIVNTVGFEGDKIFRKKVKQDTEEGAKDADAKPYPGANDRTWISSEEYEVTDEDGEFTNYDGSVSSTVHQYDRFGIPFLHWIAKKDISQDDGSNLEIPDSTT